MKSTVIYEVERTCKHTGPNYDIPLVVKDPNCGQGFADFVTMVGFGSVPVPEISGFVLAGLLMLLSGVIGMKIAAEDGSLRGINR